MLNRRLHEVEGEYNLFTLVIRPPSNYHWMAGREKFHEKLRDNFRRKFNCLLRYKFFDEFDDREQVHAHYLFMTDCPLDAGDFKAKVRELLEKTWRHVEKDMPLSLKPQDDEFHWATPSWLVVDDALNWSVYCDEVHNLTGLAKYLPKDLQDRSRVRPIPEGWPLRTRGGRDFFGKRATDYWRDTYAEWYPPAPQQHEAPPQEAQDEPGEATTAQQPLEPSSASPRPRVLPSRTQAVFKLMVMRRHARRKMARGPPTCLT